MSGNFSFPAFMHNLGCTYFLHFWPQTYILIVGFRVELFIVNRPYNTETGKGYNSLANCRQNSIFRRTLPLNEQKLV